MRGTVVVGLLTIVSAVAHGETRERTLDSAPLGVISFDRASARIQQEAMIDIEEAAEWQARHPEALLLLEGHTSRQGSSRRNVRISEARTDAVRTALIRAGADPERMMAVAYSDPRSSEQSVVMRATTAFPDLAREQRSSNLEDARRAGRALDHRAPTRPAPTPAAPAPAATPAAPAPAPTTVIVVPSAIAAAPTEVPIEDLQINGSTTGVPAGGISPTTGGNGVAAQTGIGMDPTDGSPEFTTGFGPREGFKGTGATGGAPGLVPPPGPPELVLPPGAPGARPPGAPGGIVAGAPTE
ncbi:MAG: OmpA family protein [Kofleriaceae bacterium]|nr:OmpA family protein [Kofleriaceae bacterium]